MADDILWINLKILSKLPDQSKLNTSNDLFYIEKSTFYNPISLWRWLRGDSRYMTIKKIDQVIEKASLLLSKTKNMNLLTHLKNSRQGLDNIKKTYSDDITIIAAIDRLLDKINLLLPEELSDSSDENFQDT